jgi:hypothetical protein
MEDWGAIGFFILLFAPIIGRLHWIIGVVTIAAGILVMLLAGGDGAGSLGISGLVCISSSYVTDKLTGDIEIVDIVSYIAGIVLLILAFVVA